MIKVSEINMSEKELSLKELAFSDSRTITSLFVYLPVWLLALTMPNYVAYTTVSLSNVSGERF